ncbi:conserved protein of unknown function [Tenacibaculum sp. 190524A02b]|uniref:hypothetical protein n=1 Tax=Tenacibaculum vairaonense TaxID=3137860 RepID=UPI0032B1CFE5
MIKNLKISSSINQWHIEYDPNGFIDSENWLNNAEKTEDMLQLSHVYADGPVIDVGFYGELYKIFVIYNENWEDPKEVFESKNMDLISDKVYELMDKYVGG